MLRDDVDHAVLWRTGALGDFVLTLPVLEGVRARARRLTVIAPRRFRPLWDRADCWWDADGPEAQALFSGRPLDAELGLAWTRGAATALREAGARTVLEGRPLPPDGVHQLDALWTPVAPWLGPRTALPSLSPDGPWPGPAPVVIAPGSGGVAKRWSVAAWRAVAEQVPEPLWVGGPLEAAETGWGHPRRNDLGLDELVRLAAHCRCWLGPDAGPQHVAAATGARTGVVFTGATAPSQWAPPGARVFEPWSTPDEVAAWARADSG